MTNLPEPPIYCALKRLVDLKAHKDAHGKNNWYIRNQKDAWDQAKAAIDSLGNTSDGVSHVWIDLGKDDVTYIAPDQQREISVVADARSDADAVITSHLGKCEGETITRLEASTMAWAVYISLLPYITPPEPVSSYAVGDGIGVACEAPPTAPNDQPDDCTLEKAIVAWLHGNKLAEVVEPIEVHGLIKNIRAILPKPPVRESGIDESALESLIANRKDELTKCVFHCGLSGQEQRPLLRTDWKDSIDIEEPSLALKTLTRKIVEAYETKRNEIEGEKS